MNKVVKVGLAALACACLQSSSFGLSGRQALTAAKLPFVHAYFKARGYFYSSEFLFNWQLARGRAKEFPSKILKADKDVLAFLKKQKIEIQERVEDRLRSGAYKENTSRYVIARTEDMYPTTSSDFYYAIRGCFIRSGARVRFGKADSRGRITCTIEEWQSDLTDIYTFQYEDDFNIPHTNIPVFKQGELQDFERSGAAKRFDVSSSDSFYASSLLTTFTVSKR